MYSTMFIGMAESPEYSTCDRCGERVQGPMERHVYSSHAWKNTVFICPECLTEFVHEGNVASHLRDVEGKDGCDTSSCKRSTTSPFIIIPQCRLCSFKCLSQSKMAEHLRQMHFRLQIK